MKAKKIAGFDKFMYYLFVVMSLGTLYVYKVIMRKALSDTFAE